MPEIIMPKVGDAMTEGKVVRWYKGAGDKITKGEPVLEIETDKVNLDLEAEADGTLGDLLAKEGQMVPVGETLAQILAPGEKPSENRRATDKKDSVKHTTGEYQEAIEQKGPRRDKSQAVPAQNVIAIPVAGSRQRSSPLARRMAKDLGVPLESLQGSGPQGRIIAKDVQGAQNVGRAKARPTLESKSIPLSAMRRTIAKRLAESTGPIPHFYLTVDYDVSQLVSMRQQLADIEGSKVSLNDFIIRAIALALRHHPNVNASWGDDAIEQHGEVHVGVAVATTDGLITPVIRNADQKSVSDIAKEVRVLADKAKNRKLMPNEYQGSTFTISNLGAWGIEEFTAIINPPNSAIVAIGAAEQRPVVVNGQIVVRDRMKVTMSCDHRVIDGALG
ncbi:MAG TPA: dihydrolipoamide acetyltransferase family protein, partial [Thermoanaerobaculia bacterium]